MVNKETKSKGENMNPRELKYELKIENIDKLKEITREINSNLNESLEKIDELEKRLKELNLKTKNDNDEYIPF